jgi:hypothetical protein
MTLLPSPFFVISLPCPVLMRDKENCPFFKERPHQIFFLSMPRYEKVKQSALIIDGCIGNMAVTSSDLSFSGSI